MMSGHTNHSQKHQTRVGLSQTRQGALLYTLEGVCFQSPDSLLSHISKKRLQNWGDWNFFQDFCDSAFYFLAGNFTAKQCCLRLHTGIVFVACYNELIEHQEVLGTIRAPYNSSAITLQIGSSFKVNHTEAHHPLPICVQSKAVDSCATSWFWLLSFFPLFRPSVSFARSENMGKFLFNLQYSHVSVPLSNRSHPYPYAWAA